MEQNTGQKLINIQQYCYFFKKAIFMSLGEVIKVNSSYRRKVCTKNVLIWSLSAFFRQLVRVFLTRIRLN